MRLTASQLATASIGIGLAVLGLKTVAWWITGSVALLSDAMESIVNVAAAVAALIAIRYARRPADDGHPYGHHKAELLSAVLEGVLIVLAALLILRESWHGLMSPRALSLPAEGIAVNLAATLVNAVWAMVLVRRGRLLGSPALEADGRHLWTDVVTSVGVVLGVLLAMATGWWRLDPILAALVAINVLWSGWRVIRGSMSGLMDAAVPDETLARLSAVIAREAGGALEAHDIRTRVAGPITFVDFHLVVPGETTVFDAHEICDRVEAALRAELPGTRATIHVEPEHKQEDRGIAIY